MTRHLLTASLLVVFTATTAVAARLGEVGELGERFAPHGRVFQVGQAPNRSKWGIWTRGEYVELYVYDQGDTLWMIQGPYEVIETTIGNLPSPLSADRIAQ